MVDGQHATLSIRRQCELLGLNRASFYYQATSESALNQRLIRLIDEQFQCTPFYGWPKMTAHLRRLGYAVNGKRVRRLMRLMDIQAIYPRRSSSAPDKGHTRYPYLLRNLPITHVNQVWSADITYVPLLHGFMYLVAVIDWHSRYVLAWRLTAGIQVSRDGRGRAIDNVFSERLWRSVKYENIYLQQYETARQLRDGLSEYFNFYNYERPHQSLNYRTPTEERFVL